MSDSLIFEKKQPENGPTTPQNGLVVHIQILSERTYTEIETSVKELASVSGHR